MLVVLFCQGIYNHNINTRSIWSLQIQANCLSNLNNTGVNQRRGLAVLSVARELQETCETLSPGRTGSSKVLDFFELDTLDREDPPALDDLRE